MGLEKNFAENMRMLREKHGMKQKDIADIIGCSEKTVSKWECASSIPDIEILFAIAKCFKTNVEALFASNDAVFFLGIDGGATKTHLMLTDATGTPVREIFADCCNPNDIGIEKAKAVLKQAIYEICDGIPFSSIICFAGISGGVSGGMQARLKVLFDEFGFCAVENDSDNRNIIAAALGEQDGITLILGTGVCSFLQKDGKHTFTGGKGYFIDDGGSGFDIGRQAIVAYFSEIDGVGEHTEITPLIKELGFSTPQDLLAEIYKKGKKYIASFSRIVYKAANDGDAVAHRIIKDNMERAASFVLANAKHLELKSIPIVVAGGLTNEPLTLEYLKKALGDKYKFNIKVLDCAPVIGAVKLAENLYKKGAWSTNE